MAMLMLILGLVSIPWTSSVINSGTVCGDEKYTCKYDKTCIPKEWLCDDEQDCIGGDDETDCLFECSADAFKCINGFQCVKNSWKCDGDEDCHDGSDEFGCEGVVHCANDSSHFSCGFNKGCISVGLVCDGHWDCPNGEDEDFEFCVNRTCEESHFKCENESYCIVKRWLCDGSPDCKDGSDEINCDHVNCSQAEFGCARGLPECIDLGAVCDRVEDCSDGSDERHCSYDGICPSDEIACEKSKICIPMDFFCDGKADCPGGFDEMNCAGRKCKQHEFQCLKSKFCLPVWMVCNGEIECDDGSDENHCILDSAARTCGREEFNCSGTNDSLCVPTQKLCNGFADCPNSQDENDVLCSNKSKCKLSCKHGQCIMLQEKARCVCNIGFNWSTESFMCEDVDECFDQDACGQICTNTIGSFKCSCTQGYEIDYLDHKICTAIDGEPLILFVSGKELRYINLRNHAYGSLFKFENHIKAFDVDTQSRHFFVSDHHGTIYRVNKFHPSEPKLVWKGYQSQTIENMAYDWVFQNLYVVAHQHIDMLHIPSTNEAVYFKNIVKSPKNYHYFSIVIDPRENKNHLYWTITGPNSSIVRAHLDGSMAVKFVGSNILNPVGLTIDFETDSIYWIDAKLYTISKKSLDIGDSRIYNILSSYTYIRQPISIDFFESHLFWSTSMNRINHVEVTSSFIKSYNKTAKTIKDGLNHLSVIKMAHILKQPTGNNHICSNHKCSHICLPNPTIKDYTCVCPDEVYGIEGVFKLGTDGFHCHYISNHEGSQGSYVVIAVSTVFLLIAAILVIITVKRGVKKQGMKAMDFTNPVFRRQHDGDHISFKGQLLSSSIDVTVEPHGQSS